MKVNSCAQTGCSTRTVEKAARSELGMARSDELVVVFEKKEQGSGTDR